MCYRSWVGPYSVNEEGTITEGAPCTSSASLSCGVNHGSVYVPVTSVKLVPEPVFSVSTLFLFHHLGLM